MAKFLAINLVDGSCIIYEILTGITWRTERHQDQHSGMAIITSDIMFELSKEGLEHALMEIF